MDQKTYHLRRKEQAISDPGELLEIIQGQRCMTLALCRDGEPYLATVSHGYDAAARCFYFHCARRGKKIDYLEANPIVWGQVLEDRGYLTGQCDHAYRTVQFRGRAELVEDLEEKRRALTLMIERLEPDPEPLKQRLLVEARLRGVCIVRVRVLEMTGKHGNS
ncbi:MAG TPA: pyridoxamine 5'-phosphate oxidase family protein [Anaerolineae bacterium]|nr:pyridoxamine 5'-phosphate oxidase family protein [Anaerolineae bacterium]HOQ98795.1 pyridoxamine 5'-phosphate oxidase family protein [Anaerolineae bacterium]HPL26980.1 pyridoxamine 5'-phosphate oxidase family protein [Anaerolineae bacterium]